MFPSKNNVSDHLPLKVLSVEDVSTPDNDDEVSKEILFEDDNTFVGVLPVLTSLNIF